MLKLKGTSGMNKKLWLHGLTIALLLTTPASWAAVFEITPQGTLPTEIIKGETLYAYYNIHNNSDKNLRNNLLHLPKNVEQSSLAEPAPSPVVLCDEAPFDLAAHATCTLKLAVTGKVRGISLDPHHHIQVCLSDDLNCSRTALKDHNVLHVKAKTLQTAYIASQEYNTTGGVATCQVKASDGSLINCDYASKEINFNTPADVIINKQVNPPLAYVANFGSGTNGYISVCTLKKQGQLMQINSCNTVRDSEVFAPVGLRLSPDGKRLYITNSTVDVVVSNLPPVVTSVAYCEVDKSGNLNAPCQNVLGTTFNGPGSVWIAGDFAYIANNDSHYLSICPMQKDKTFGHCTGTTQIIANTPVFVAPSDVIINEPSSVAYVSGGNPNAGPSSQFGISICDVDLENGSLDETSCTLVSDPSFYFVGAGLQMSPDNKWLYATNYNGGSTENSISVCAVNNAGGLSDCQVAISDPSGATLNTPAGRIAFKQLNGTDYAYIANYGSSVVTYCPYNSTTGKLGPLAKCKTTGNVDNGSSIAIVDNYLYIPKIAPSTFEFSMSICPIHSNGSLGICQLSNGDGQFENGFFVANILVENNIAYVPNSLNSDIATQKIVFCQTKQGMLKNCSDLIQPLPNGRMIFASFKNKPYVYVVDNSNAASNRNFGKGKIFKCSVKTNGMFANCEPYIWPFTVELNDIYGLDLNAAENLLYATIRVQAGVDSVLINALDKNGNINDSVFELVNDSGFIPLSNLWTENNNNALYIPQFQFDMVTFCDQNNINNCGVFASSHVTINVPASMWTTRF